MTQNAAANPGPLQGIRILDLSRILAGPTCTQLLGDLGADVIKIEKPNDGDDTRSWGPPYLEGAEGPVPGQSAYFMAANRNKRSVAVDLTNPAGVDLVKELAAECDVLVENFKVDGLRKFGLGYADLADDFPFLVYCSISGYGQTGPNRHRPGYDLVAQGFGGIMSLTGEVEGEPTRVGVGIADVMCGMYASTAILAALRHRDKTGEGQHIDLALVDSQVAWLINEGTNYMMSGQAPIRRGNQHPNIVPYQVFAAADGHLIVAVGNDTQFRKFCELIDRADLADDDRYATNSARLEHRAELCEIIAGVLSAWRRQALLDGMEACGIPGGPINSVAEVFASDQVSAREMRVRMRDDGARDGYVDLIGNPLKFSKSPVSYRRSPPSCGADTEATIRDILGEEAVDEARLRGLLGADE